MFNDDFYPTPSDMTMQMLAKIKKETVSTILEPSAGRGDMVEAIKSAWPSWREAPVIDTIEIEPELRAILKDKGYAPVAADFLTFRSFKRYDLIMMNPPFSDGAAHLHKALDLVADGGQVVCLLNAETIRNPYTNERRDLVQRLEELGASIDYIADGFTTAVRTTSVEVAFVYVTIAPKRSSNILENLAEAQRLEDEQSGPSSEVVEGDYIRGAVRRYELEAAAGVKLIREYEALRPILTRSFAENGLAAEPIIKLTVADSAADLVNEFVEHLRSKYWGELFQSSQFAQMFTTETRRQYREQIDDLSRYEFNLVNIKQMQIDISASMLDTLDDAIVRLFDKFSQQYYDEYSKNIHYYNGWKTNKAHQINRKVVTRLNAFGWYSGSGYNPAGYEVVEFLADVEKVFGYLDGQPQPTIMEVQERLKRADDDEQTKGVDLTYCSVDFFKKGTAHITFTRDDLLKKFNLIGSQRKGWLPPNYGRAGYDDMTDDEQAVVDAFEGRDSYDETVERQAFYLCRPAVALGIGAEL